MIKYSENAWRGVQARDAYGGHVTIPGGDQSQDELDAKRDAARAKYIRRSENAWKNTGGVKFGYGFGG